MKNRYFYTLDICVEKNDSVMFVLLSANSQSARTTSISLSLNKNYNNKDQISGKECETSAEKLKEKFDSYLQQIRKCSSKLEIVKAEWRSVNIPSIIIHLGDVV
jgi:esterase/lipase